jgi:WhiB family redox-sensing transcriptional regulator
LTRRQEHKLSKAADPDGIRGLRVFPVNYLTIDSGVDVMYTATAPPASGSVLELGGGVAELLDATPTTGPELPCQVNNPDLWFAEAPTDLERAKTMCADCPVRAQCLAGALARREPWGVWGGEIFERGLVIPRKRPRGRPRKDDRRHDPVPSVPTDKAAKEAAA